MLILVVFDCFGCCVWVLVFAVGDGLNLRGSIAFRGCLLLWVGDLWFLLLLEVLVCVFGWILFELVYCL